MEYVLEFRACEQEQMLQLTSFQQTCMTYLTSSFASRLPACNIVGALYHKL